MRLPSRLSLRRSEKLKKRRKALEERLLFFLNLRLGFGLAAFFCAFVDVLYPHRALAGGIILFLAIFAFLVFVSRRIRRFGRKLELLAEYYDRQLARWEGHPPARHAAGIFPEHSLAGDLDLFGSHSLFSQISETFSEGGDARMIEEMLEPKYSREEILRRQGRVRAAAANIGLFRRLVIEGRFEGGEMGLATAGLRNAVRSPLVEKVTVPAVLVLLLWAVWAVSLFLDVPSTPVWFLFFAGNLWTLRDLGEVWSRVQIIEGSLKRLLGLFRLLERVAANPNLRDTAPAFQDKPSARLRVFSRLVSFLSTATHPVVQLAVNALSPWTWFFSILSERERRKIAGSLGGWLDGLVEAEIVASLAAVVCHQTDVFPGIQAKPVLKMKGLFHPLLRRTGRVANDYEMRGAVRTALITGSNMSGKSTFLRAIGLSQVMSMMGGPAFAGEFTTFAGPVSACLRVSDSVRDGFSYFYAEVRRLAAILDLARAGKPALYLIDEVFRGTNNRERLEGARAFISEITKTSSLGFVTTHDLDLVALADRFDSIENRHFRDEIRDGRMVFPYALQPGPCPTTNALRIMKDAGLPVILLDIP